MTIATNIILAIRIYALYGHERKGENKSNLIDPCFSTPNFVGWFMSLLILGTSLYYSNFSAKWRHIQRTLE